MRQPRERSRSSQAGGLCTYWCGLNPKIRAGVVSTAREAVAEFSAEALNNVADLHKNP